MSTLYLVRHGQASFGAANYDALSALGAAQSRHLGTDLATRKRTVHALYSGPLQRQIDTARHLVASARAAGAEYPEPEIIEELAEYPALELVRYFGPRLGAAEPALAALLAGGGTDLSAYARGLALISERWVRGELVHDELESFVQFRERVRQGLDWIMEREGRSRGVLVVTSGGPIGVAVQMALGIADGLVLPLVWGINNASLSELRYRTPGELSLLRFNGVAHLPEDTLITYR